MNTPVITTTISAPLLAWLNERAKETKQTRREVLEEALEKYRKEIRRAELRADLLLEAQDPEVMAIAEEGMGDYAAMLAEYD
jgi:metal-responsive CopG/Arc/MetJ family transcriptional regulator